MGTTQNYGYNVPVGSDNVNLLPQMAANFPMIDSDLKAVSNAAIGSATELTTGTVHALTRADTNRNVFVFVATSNYEAGETFEVDGVQVTAKTPDGQNLSTGAYVINSGVLCVLNGTLLTVFVSPTKALDADKLDGHDSSYFATAANLSALNDTVDAVSDKVGSGVLNVGNDCVDGINEIYASLIALGNVTNMSDSHGYMNNIVGGYSTIGKIVIVGGSFELNGNAPINTSLGGRFPAPNSFAAPIMLLDSSTGDIVDAYISNTGDLVNLGGSLVNGHNIRVSGAYLSN